MDITVDPTLQQAIAVRENLKLILQEQSQLAENLDYTQFNLLISGIQQAGSIFLTASGRSAYSMRAFAMRLMHLGLRVYFTGDTTTPAIKKGDLLIAASGSGTTSGVVKAAQTAKTVGAQIISITTNKLAPLALLSDYMVCLPAPDKQNHAGNISRQYAGSLFEQAVLLITDAVFLELWRIDGTSAEELWTRHANIE